MKEQSLFSFVKKNYVVSALVFEAVLILLVSGLVIYNNRTIDNLIETQKYSEKMKQELLLSTGEVKKYIDFSWNGLVAENQKELIERDQKMFKSQIESKFDKINALFQVNVAVSEKDLAEIRVVSDTLKSIFNQSVVLLESKNEVNDSIQASSFSKADVLQMKEKLENETFKIISIQDKLIANAQQEYASTKTFNLILLLILTVFGLPLAGILIVGFRKDSDERDKLMKMLEQNNRKYLFDNGLENELIEPHKIVSNFIEDLQKAADFITHISMDDYEVKWDGITESNKKLNESNLVGKLIAMRDQMKIIKVEDARRNWTNVGISQIGDLLRKHEDVVSLSDRLLSWLIKYVNGIQGMIFLVNDDNKNDAYLELISTYAFDRKKFVKKRIEKGEGLAGQAWEEGETIFLTEIPQDYLQITSGLGASMPSNVLIVPLKIDMTIVGILEISSFKAFEPFEISFVEKASESISSSFLSVKINERTRKLLSESQSQSEQMRQQEEEMRQNMEELQAAQEGLQRNNIEMENAEKNLKESRNYLDTIINSIPTPVFVKDKDHRLVLLNDAYAKFIGRNKENLQFKNDYEIFPQEQAAKFWNSDKEIFGSDQVHTDEEIITNAKGEEKTVINYRYPFKSDNGESFLVATLVDISERVSLEKELSKERFLMDALMKKSLDFIYFKDSQSRFLKVSNNMAPLFGCENTSMLMGKSDFDFFTSEHALPAFNQEQEIIKTGIPVINLVEKETFEDGRVSYVSTTKMPLQDEKGDTIGIFGISRDVTKNKVMELELIQKAQQLSLILEKSTDLSTIIEGDGKIRYQTPAFNDLIGYKEDQVVGKQVFDFVVKEDVAKLKKTMETIKLGNESKITLSFRKNSGELVLVESTLQNLLEDENVKGYIVHSKAVINALK